MSNQIEEMLQKVFKAAFSSDLDKIKEIHNDYLALGLQNAIINHSMPGSTTSDKEKKFKYFLAEGADVNRSVEGIAPLTMATHLGNKLFVELLLEHGADINSTDANGLQSLTILMRNNSHSITNRLEILKLLLEHNPDINNLDFDDINVNNAADKLAFRGVIEQKLLTGIITSDDSHENSLKI